MMPYVKCSKCHHEREVCLSEKDRKCDWCGALKGLTLEEVTPFEKYIKSMDMTGSSSWALPDGWKIF
jgi:hypothetical protein